MVIVNFMAQPELRKPDISVKVQRMNSHKVARKIKKHNNFEKILKKPERMWYNPFTAGSKSAVSNN